MAGEIGTQFLKPVPEQTCCGMIRKRLQEASDMNSGACSDADPERREAGTLEGVAKEEPERNGRPRWNVATSALE